MTVSLNGLGLVLVVLAVAAVLANYVHEGRQR